MCGCCVLVHRFSRLGAAVAAMAAEILCGDGVSTNWTLERAKTVHHFDRIMSHSFSVVAYPAYDSKLKFNSRFSSRLRLRSVLLARQRPFCLLLLIPVPQALGGSLQLGGYELDQEPICRPIAGLRHVRSLPSIPIP